MAKKKVRKVLMLDEDEIAIVIKKDRHYRLGYPVLDIMIGSIIIESDPVHWDEIEQNWVDDGT